MFRADLLAAGVGEGRHGFRLVLPTAAAHDLGRLRVEVNGEPLIPSAATSVDPRLQAAWPPLLRREADRLTGVAYKDGIVRAWIGEDQAGTMLTVTADEAFVWAGLPRRVETAFAASRPRRGFGLRVQVPAPTTPVGLRSISVRSADGDLPGSPLQVDYAMQFAGFVESVAGGARLSVQGWCVDRANPSSPIRLRVEADGRELAGIETAGTRRDLFDAGFDAPDAVFQAEFDEPFNGDVEVTVTPVNALSPLPGARRPVVDAARLAAPARTEVAPIPVRPLALSRPAWGPGGPKIAFVVTEASMDTAAGDYLTAVELSQAMTAQQSADVRFLEMGRGTEHAVGDADILIAMRDDYDPRRIVASKPELLTAAYIRNWFDRFAASDAAGAYDLVLASSRQAASYLAEHLARPVEMAPIATNIVRFSQGRPRPDLASDCAFTGAYWDVNRELAQNLEPSGLPFRFALFGHGWNRHPVFAPYARGHVPYATLPDVYASTRLVIDDANHVTKRWGSVNSRVFDALAAGAMVVTNGEGGSEALFDGLLPVYRNAQELEALLWTYLGDEAARLARVKALRAIVESRHTYAHRAEKLWRLLREAWDGVSL